MAENKKTEKFNKTLIFIEYIPAELNVNKERLIIYYYKNPITCKMERRRLRVPKIINTTEREKLLIVRAYDK